MSDFLAFLKEGVTPWHVCEQICARLIERQFVELDESTTWQLEAGKSYFLQRDGAVIAFRLPKKKWQKATFLAAHTDSPCFKLKPHPEHVKQGMTFLNAEIYGAPILSSWLNRDLMVTGRVVLEKGERLIKLDDHPLVIPSIALHLQKDLNEKNAPLDKQKHLAFLADIAGDEFLFPLLQKKAGTILDFDLFIVPAEEPSQIGKDKQLIASHRIDNLAGVHAALMAITSASANETMPMAVFYNAEEIGSMTLDGARSPFLSDIFRRIALCSGLSEEEFFCAKNQSFFISIDGAHGYHPAYSDKYDPNHIPLLGKGIVFKYSASQKYTSNARSAAMLIKICQKHDLAYQKFASHAAISSGSTVGPLSVSELGCLSVDIGIPQLSMHSAREIMAAKDHETMCRLLTAVVNE